MPTGRRCLAFAALICLAMANGPTARAADGIDIAETFASPPVAKGRELLFGGLAFREDSNPDGEFSLLPGGGIRLTVRPGANHKAKRGQGDLYDRAELREARARYLAPGTPVWYRFAMRAGDDFPSVPGRLVAFQLKTSYLGYDDAHPAFAVRIENRRLFATVEQLWRPGDPEIVAPVPAGGTCPDGTALGRRNEPGVPQAGVLLAVDPGGLVEHRTGQFTVCVSGVTVRNHAPLPALGSNWIDFELSVRTGAKGAIELFADGALVASATGDFGDGAPGGDQYLKLGPYRDKSELVASLAFARFRRAATREGLR